MPTTTPARNVTGIVADALAAQPGVTAAELAELCGLGRSTVAKRLAALEMAGQARREPGDDVGLRKPDRWSAVAQARADEPTGHGPGPVPGGARGRTAVLARGELRELVLDHVRGTQTPVGAGVVAGVLGRSSGAVGNALERLAAAGLIVRLSTSPRRYGPLPIPDQRPASQAT